MRIKILTILTIVLASMNAMAQVDRSVMPKPKKTPTINLGTPETFQLPNGLTLMVVENHKLPKVSMSLVMDTPPVLEGDKAGISMITSSLMGKGSKNISKDDFNEEVDLLGARISVSPNGAYATSLSKFFPRVLELTADAALQPNFTQEELDKEKETLVENLKSQENNAGAIVSRNASALLYGTNHPYGEFTTQESVKGVTLEDVKQFYANHFSPSNAYMIISGDITADKAKELVEDYFKDWLPSKAMRESLATPSNSERLRIDFIDLPSAVQSEIRGGRLIDVKMSDKDYFPLLVANYILGGSFSSYINMNLREKHGYTYGAYSSSGNDKWTKAKFGVSTQVRNAVTDSSVVQILKEIDRMRDTYVDDEVLKNAKAKYSGSFIMATENPKTIASYALNIITQNLSDDFYKNYIKNINAVTKEDIKRVANKYFTPDDMRFVIVGKGSEVADKLEQIEYHGKKIPVYYHDKYGKLIQKPEFSKKAPKGVNAQSILNDYLSAIGGKSAVEKVTSYRMEGEAEMQGMKIQLNLTKMNNNLLNQTISVMGNVMSKQVYNKGKAYIEMQGQKQELPQEQTDMFKDDINLFPELEYLKDNNVKLLGIENVEGEEAYALQISEDKKVYYSTDSKLKVQEQTTRKVQGKEIISVTSYSDYKEVKGIKFPFVLKQNLVGQDLEFKMTKISVNEGVSLKDFE